MVSVGLYVPLKQTRQGSRGGGVPRERTALVDDEPDTKAWFDQALQSEFAIVDFFPDDSGRQAHLSGKVAEALMAEADELFAVPPDIDQVDVVASKLPG